MNESQIRDLVRQEIRASASGSRFGFGQTQRHVHNGVDTPQINQQDVVPGIRASGSITFAQTAQYRLGLTFNPTSVWFYGNAFSNSLYTFDISTSVRATSGAVYTNNGQTFTLPRGVNHDATMKAVGTGDPSSSGTLTLVSGTGDPTIDFTAVSNPTYAIRAACIGNAQLGPSFYFQPSTDTSVKIGGPVQPLIQSSSTFLVDSSNPALPVVRATADEGHLVDVEYGAIVARATIVSYSPQEIVIDVALDSTGGWSIVGNYVVT